MVSRMQCMEGLHFMYSWHVVHSDIHPRNIMYAVDEDRPSGIKWYYIDFEMCRQLPPESGQLIRSNILNPGFDPPERQIWDNARCCFAPFDPYLDDVYATGMFFVLLPAKPKPEGDSGCRLPCFSRYN